MGNLDFILQNNGFTPPPDPFFEDMEQCFREWARVMKPGGKAFIVIGGSIVSGQPLPVGDRFIKILEQLGFNINNRWIRNIQTNRKSLNKEARIQKEHVLLFDWKGT